MSGILGVINFSGKEIEKEKILEAWKRIEHRGKDFYTLWVDGEWFTGKNLEECTEKIPENFHILLAQNSLSVSDKPNIPLEKDEKVILGDVEIYDSEELGGCENDLEVFFDHGLEKINGIYACVELDLRKNTLRLFRDPIGVNPLCFAYGKNLFAFASEMKALGIFRDSVSEFNHLHPRKILYLSITSGKTHSKEHPVKIDFFPKSFTRDYRKLEDLLLKAVELQTAGLEKFGILFSGGLDTCLLAKLCLELERKFTCFTCGTENSEDLKYARKFCDEYGIKLKEVVVSESDVENALEKVVHAIETKDFVQVSIALPLYFASLASRKAGNKVALSGAGAEELFAGYYKYRKNLEKLHEICAKGLENLWIKDLYRDNCIVMSNAQELRVPYLDLKFAEYAMKISPRLKVINGIEKYVLRKIAEKHIASFAWRKKKAAQYGSGAVKILKALAKKRGFKRKSDLLQALSVADKNNFK